ncbi:hypothetical protein RJ640_016493 [Escallonia rubra]|uniref:Protein kinase domain-containing protein n=1 Tax=Escallonia rubra TaxID=112253 RepID=A0AA88RKE2_9ASTE|nr:hypothetical protein RJ640_016493 [Escallonia rubra]
MYVKVRLIPGKLAKMKARSSTDKAINETPVSLLEIKVTLPTRVICGDEASSKKYDPSDIAQLPKVRLGEGTLGTLYKVVLNCGSIVTIRKIRDELVRSDDFEFWIKFFGGVRDARLLPMQFSCWYGGQVFLVHEYLCLGSLEELLHGSEGVQFTPLNCKIRLQIALDAAKALASIHNQVTKDGRSLVCGVIKSSNIMIRIDFSACLSSFETSYLVPPAIIVRRNPGRIAPELTYYQSIPKVFTQKSDVYSFGVLLLELITGKRPSVTNLGEYVKEKARREGLKAVPDKRMVNAKEIVADMISIAGQCLTKNPRERPPMDRVVEMIQELQESSSLS